MRQTPAPPASGVEESLQLCGEPARGLADPAGLGPRQRRRRAFTLLLLTLLIPGSAQIAAGSRTLGRIGLRTWAGAMAAAVLLLLVFLVHRPLALGLLARPWVLTALEWALLAMAALWAVLFVDAWRLGQPRALVITARRWLGGATAALLAMTTGGLVYAANSVAVGRDALGSLFSSRPALEPTDGRYNILLLGGDSGKSRVGTRPDSLQLVSVDAETGRAVVFGFSRDTENITFRPGSVMSRVMPQGWNCGDACLLNGLYTWAEENRDAFPAGTQNPGLLATREAVEALSGLDIHYHLMVDLLGFQRMIDTLGGLEITVQRRTPIGGGTSRISGWIEPGRQHLDGQHALWYARSREGSTNYERMARQRCVMTAMVRQLEPQTVALRFPGIAAASTGVIETDLPQSELGFFADLALKTRSQKIKGVNFVPPLIKPWDYDPAFVTSTVTRTIAASERASRQSQAVSPPKPAGGTTPRPPAEQHSHGAPNSPPAGGGALARPAEDPRAATADLAEVCSAG
jgi:LCP family protein required for cell wall assembly